MRILSAKWKALLGGRERWSRLSTTSPNVSSKVKSSDPCLVFNSRQREGEFFKQGCGDKGTLFLVFLFRSQWHKRVTFSFSGRNVE